MPDRTLTVVGALLDLLAVCHKNRGREALMRAWSVVVADGTPNLAQHEAFAFVAERHGYGRGPWSPDEHDDEEPTDA